MTLHIGYKSPFRTNLLPRTGEYPETLRKTQVYAGRFCLPPLRQILLSAANCIRSRRLLNEYFPPSRYTGREME